MIMIWLRQLALFGRRRINPFFVWGRSYL